MFQFHFVLQNIHFTIYLLAAFLFFAIFCLYLDAWINRRSIPDALKIVGYLFLAISFTVQGTHIEQTILEQPLFGSHTILLTATLLRIVGYGFVIMGLYTDPIQQRPVYKTTEKLTALFVLPVGIWPYGLTFFLPIMSSVIGFLYIRRATVGFEHHLRAVGFSFFILSLSELFALTPIFRAVSHVDVFSFVAPFGPLWLIQHVLLLIAAFFFGKWVFQYLLTRIQTQLYIFFTTGMLVVFLLITVTFTSLLLNNMQQDALEHLRTDVQMLQYALDSKKAETLSDAQVIAQNPAVVTALLAKDRAALQTLTESFLLTKKSSSLLIVGEDGVVVFRAEEPDRFGESISEDLLFKRGATGEMVSSIVLREGVLAPQISVLSVAPIQRNNAVLGTVFISTRIDNVFIDEVKRATGLDISIYGNNIRSATTFLSPDGKTRWLGIKEEDPRVKARVLEEGKVYQGQVDLLNVSYLAAYTPLLDADTNPVGMILIAREQGTVLRTAAQSIQWTFIFASILLGLMFVPAYFIAKYITYQIK